MADIDENAVYIIDGYGLIFRAYFAFLRAPIRNSKGENTSAIFGYFRILATFIRQYKPKYLAVAMDPHGPTFRDEIFPEYKGTRDETPDELKTQFPLIEKMTAALGLPMLRVDRFEADDVMATVAAKCREQNRTCVIISADKDLLQLVGPLTKVLKPAKEGGFTEMGRQEVFDEKGVWPEQVLDYLSLLGDTADNVPGVKGIGEKTASKLLSDFQNLDGIYANLDKITSASQREKLEAGKNDAYFSQKLITLREDVPMPPGFGESWDAMHVESFNGQAASALLKEHGINQLAVEIGRLGGGGTGAGIKGSGSETVAEAAGARATGSGASSVTERATASPVPAAGIGQSTLEEPAKTGDGVQTVPVTTFSGRPESAANDGKLKEYDPSHHTFELVKDLDGVRRWADKMRKAGAYVLDTETDGLDPHTSRLCGISICVQPDEACYIPLWGPGPANNGKRSGPVPFLPADEVRAILKPVIEDPKLKLVGQNIKFDYLMLKAWGVVPANVWFDTMIAAWLSDTTANVYGMDELARIYLGYKTIHFDDLFQDIGFLQDGERSVYDRLDAADLAEARRKHLAELGESGAGNQDSSVVAAGGVGVPGSGGHLDFGDEDSGDNGAASGGVAKKGKLKAEDMRFSRVPLEKAAIYSAEDCDVTFKLWKFLEADIEKKGLEKLLHELEMPLIPVLAAMEWKGMVLKADYLANYSLELADRLKTTEQEIYTLVGHPFNIGSPKQLQEVLFVERKLQGTKKTKTGYSTDTSVLEELAFEDPVPQKILDYRGLAKLKSTYVDSLPLMINPVTGRVHTNFVQTGTATGRIASKDPNLQNIPIKDEDGRRIREAFVPAKGHVYVSADYSQIELVVLAHFAKDKNLSDAFIKGVDVHRSTGSLIFGVTPEEVTPEQRRVAKTINFGVMYGMGAFRLSKELSIPQRDAAAFIAAYFATYNGIRSFIDNTVKQAEIDGGVRTMLGRFRPIQQINSRNKTEKQAAERVAVNTPIQGSAADIVKLAMLRVAKRLDDEKMKTKLILQVHDELILEAPLDEQERAKTLIAEEMGKAVTLDVPLRSSVEIGDSWGVMH